MSLNGKKFLDNLQQLQSTDKVRSFFEYFSEAIAEKYARNLAVLVRETRESLQDVIADLARRFRFAQDHFEVDPVTLIRFFESEEYWNFQYSSTADHVACDYLKRFKNFSSSMKIISLSSNSSILTAIGNDIDFNKIYSQQIKNLASKGDILIIFSVSGNSKNLLEAARISRKKGLLINQGE